MGGNIEETNFLLRTEPHLMKQVIDGYNSDNFKRTEIIALYITLLARTSLKRSFLASPRPSFMALMAIYPIVKSTNR